MSSREKKILLIGAKGYQQREDNFRIDNYLWKDLKKIKNIRDYDTIIVDLLEIEKEEDRNNIDWNEFKGLFNIHNTIDILYHMGEIIIVGDPRFMILSNSQKDQQNDNESIPFLNWTGILFMWDSQPGDTIDMLYTERYRRYERYISHLNSWMYSLANIKINLDIIGQRIDLKQLKSNNRRIDLKQYPYCCNRYRFNLISAISYVIFQDFKHDKSEEIKETGDIVFLPKISLSHDETRQIILSDFCGVPYCSTRTGMAESICRSRPKGDRSNN